MINCFMVKGLAIIIDTGIFYGFFNRKDVHHMDSICILAHSLEGKWGRAYTSDLIISETYTLLRYRMGNHVAQAFLDMLRESGIKTLFLDEEHYEHVVDTLRRFPNVNLSFTDAFTIVAINKLKIRYLASYDESFSIIIRNVIGKGYAESLSEAEIKDVKRKLGLL